HVEDGRLRVEGGRGGLTRGQANGQRRLVLAGILYGSFVGVAMASRIELKAQVVAGKVVEVVDGMLRQLNEMLGLLFGERIGANGYAERENGAAGLDSQQSHRDLAPRSVPFHQP